DIGGGLPYYVVGKNMDTNEVYVSTNLNDETLWRSSIELSAVHWIGAPPASETVLVRVRHRAPLVSARFTNDSTLKLDEPQRAVTPGQSVVIYDDDICYGGGIVV